MKRRLCAVLAACLLLCGCNLQLPQGAQPSDPSSDSPSAAEKADALVLGYLLGDALHPYRAASDINARIAALMYQGLTVPDQNDVPQLCLADRAEYDGDKCITVHLSPDARFSDGAAVTARDVQHSLSLAQRSACYAEMTAAIERLQVQGDTLHFYLRRRSYLPQALLAFPIVSAATDRGSGPYIRESDTTLAAIDPSCSLQRITLRGYSDLSALRRARGGGEISLWHDQLQEGFVPRLSGAAEQMPLSVLTVLGFGSKGEMSDPRLRQLISAAIDRTALANGAFEGYARPYYSLFSPAVQAPSVTKEEKLQDIVAKLKELGYNGDGYAPKTLRLSLIVCRDSAFYQAAARQLADRLSLLSVEVTVRALSAQQYAEALRAGDFDLYLGEIGLPPDWDLTAALDAASASLYAAGDAESFCTHFAGELPFAPLLRRCGMVSYVRNLQHTAPTALQPFPQIQQWKF